MEKVSESKESHGVFDCLFKASKPGEVNPKLDERKFLADIMEAKSDVEKSVTKEAIEHHFNKIVTTKNLLFMIGVFTLGNSRVNSVVPIVAFVLYHMSMWTIIAHHSCHGGYDKTSLKKYHRGSFGKGFLRRLLDWPDWFMPEAWAIEHNKYHHYYLNESKDPDFVQGNVLKGGGLEQSKPHRFILNIISMATWRWSFYCVNTYKVLYNNDVASESNKDDEVCTLLTLFKKPLAFIFSVIRKVYLPYLFLWYFALPLLVGHYFSCPLWEIYKKLFIIELLTNIYTFTIIVTNHCGSDLYQFKNSYNRDTSGFLLHAILGSVNYNYGNDFVDFLHGYLNYQIEHHMFPDLSCLEYQLLAPRVRKICREHGVPYLKESCLIRVIKTFRVMMTWDTMTVYEDRQ